MPALLAIIGSVLSTIGGFLAQYFGRRAAVKLMVVTVGLSLLGAMIVTINGIAAGLAVALPSWVSIGASWVMPSNVNECIAACAAARVTRYAFDWNMFFLSSKV